MSEEPDEVEENVNNMQISDGENEQKDDDESMQSMTQNHSSYMDSSASRQNLEENSI